MKSLNIKPLCYFSDFDIFAKRLGLYHNGKERIGSYFGSSLTLVYIILSLSILTYYTISTIKKEDLQVHDSTEYSVGPPFIDLNNSNLLYFAFGVENANNASRFIDETIYRARAIYYYGEKNSGGAFDTVEYRDLKIEKCKVEKFGKEYEHLFTKGEFDNSYCVDNFDIFLTGGFIYDKFSCIRIQIYPCVNTTANNNHCKSQEDIDKVLAGGYFSILLKDVGLNPTNYTYPTLPTVQDFYTTISKDFFKDVIFNYEITDIETDYGLFYEKKKRERFLRYDKIKESFYSRDDKEYYYKGKNICKVEIRLSDNIHVQRRSYKKMSSVFTVTGGYMQVLYTFFMLLSFIPNKFTLEKIIVNSLLNIDFTVNKKRTNIYDNIQHNSLFYEQAKKTKKLSNKIEIPTISLKIEDNNKKSNNSFNNYHGELDNIVKIHKKDFKNQKVKDFYNSSEKGKNMSLDYKINNISKIEMIPKNSDIHFSNIDKISGSKNNNSNKYIISYPKEHSFFNNARKKGIKKINFSIFDYYCIGKFLNKKKKIELFNKGCILYREQMDIIHIFRHLLDMEKSINEKNNITEEMKLFLKQSFA